MFEKTLMTLAAAAAIAAAAAVAIVALAFAFYAALVPHIGQAFASASVAGVCALLVLVAGLIAANKVGGHHGHHHGRGPAAGPVDHGLVEKIIDIVRERPILASGAALAAGIFALRNPAFMSALIKGFMDTTTTRRD